ncbi:MAG: hypothetical protein COX48_01395, partial [bacterium (Candidatus Stahlbacteria) CG23_combo_of_CG06-09_8_20_14_all_34_7]
MKKILCVIFILEAICLFSETKVGENKFVKFVSEQESLFLYRNSKFFDKEILLPDKNWEYKYKTTINDTILAFATPDDSLIGLYTINRKNEKLIQIYLADNYEYFKMNTQALENYKKAFENNKNDYASYDRMIEFFSKHYPDSLVIVMDKYLEENPKNINVLYKNATMKRNLNLEYRDLIEQAIPIKEISLLYFDIILSAIYEIKDLNEESAKSLVDFAIDNFYSYDDFVFILYYVMDNYSSERFDTNIAKNLSEHLVKPISDEVRFYISAYLIDNNYMNSVGLSSIKTLIGSEIYPDYGEYILYYAVKGHLQMNEADSSYMYILKSTEEFNPTDYDFQKMKFEICLSENDTVNAIDSGIKILTYDRKKKDILDRVISLSGQNIKSINNRIDEYLEKESENKEFADIVLTSLEGKEKKFSQYKNKVVLIDFFGTWCGPCIMEIPDIIKIKKEYSKEKKIAFVAVSSETDAEVIREFTKNMSFDYDIYYNGESLMDREGIKGVPTIFLIDKKGKVCYTRVGYSEENHNYL